ncbi:MULTISPECIES: potassium channel family protein [Sphingobacterium]|uniref:Potassium channel family protein n=1 Tax=Sphingobacterium populi TaxID=1812824 RepID=A0ABW5UCL3_9SPHI|nr:TrkA family potassium uptake protein [Sphingobacterium sp. CFCC 11742]
MKYIVLGLGHFGRSLAIRLTEMGHEVIGVDVKLTLVEQFKDRITHTVCLDATDRESVRSLPLKDSDAVIVGIGEDGGASILATALLKQLQVKRIIGRVISDLQKTVLEAMDIAEYVMPEEEAATRLAMRLDNIDIVDSFQVSEKYSIIETKVPNKYVGLSLQEANLTNLFKVIVLTTLREQADNVHSQKQLKREATGIAKSDTILQDGDVLVLFGEMADIMRLIRKGE